MRAAITFGLLLGLGISPAARAELPRKISTCFEEYLAPLALGQLEEAASLCDQIIKEKSASPATRGAALAQRGLIYARQWRITERLPQAVEAIADITEGLRLHAPDKDRKLLLLIVRAQLYVTVGQTRRAADDYLAVLAENPDDAVAKAGLARLGPPENY